MRLTQRAPLLQWQVVSKIIGPRKSRECKAQRFAVRQLLLDTQCHIAACALDAGDCANAVDQQCWHARTFGKWTLRVFLDDPEITAVRVRQYRRVYDHAVVDTCHRKHDGHQHAQARRRKDKAAKVPAYVADREIHHGDGS